MLVLGTGGVRFDFVENGALEFLPSKHPCFGAQDHLHNEAKFRRFSLLSSIVVITPHRSDKEVVAYAKQPYTVESKNYKQFAFMFEQTGQSVKLGQREKKTQCSAPR